MLVRLATVLLLLSMPAFAEEQQKLSGEADMGLAATGVVVQAQQLSLAYGKFMASYQGVREALEQARRVAAYWEDACRSTPSCGGVEVTPN